MTKLAVRAHVAVAAQGVTPSWPISSFVAVNPLAADESRRFESATSAARLTRDLAAYQADLVRGRITEADLEAALRERIPELCGDLVIAGERIPAMRVAIIDLVTASWTADPSPEAGISGLDEYLSRWLALALDTHPVWPMPHRELGLYGAWRRLAPRDPALPKSVRRAAAHLPVEPESAITWALERFGIDPARSVDLLRRELAHLPGWVGMIRWRSEHVGDADLTSYLAVRLALRALLGLAPDPAPTPAGPAEADREDVWGRAAVVAGRITSDPPADRDVAAVARVLLLHPVADHRFTWQKAYEIHYRTGLLAALRPDAPRTPTVGMQLVMCIDPRSEGMRRRLEELGEIETFGFAGFFGVPLRFTRYQADEGVVAAPALISPRHRVTEVPVSDRQASRHVARGRTAAALRRALDTADAAATTPFGYAETSGWFYGALALARTIAPGWAGRIVGRTTVTPDDLPSRVAVASAFDLDERVTIAEAAVRMMGMDRFSPLVILAGHGSHSTNNLYQSAYECGACGGNPGAGNARAAAAVFNDPEVRSRLRARGIEIPDGTVFVAALHDTVSDLIRILDRHLIPDGHLALVDDFLRIQRGAADLLVAERAATLPGADPNEPPTRVRRRALDWAEVYPELGLAGNAAIVIGPRELTRGVDLGRRVFLHSYRAELDPSGTALETILTAPLVVAQWINHQYYFSALNPETLGSGTKPLQNAVGTVGVLTGGGGDLRRGLPWQCVGYGPDLLHEPMRLTAVVHAPLDRIGEIISRNQVLRNLLDNDWITLTALDGDRPLRYTSTGWTPVAARSTTSERN